METLDSVASDRNLSNENVDQTAEDDRNDVDSTAMESTETACADQTVEDYGNNIDPTAAKSTEIAFTDEAMKEACTENSEEPSQTESCSGSSSSVDPHSLVEPREDEHGDREKIGDKVERNTEEERLKKREMLLEKMVEENEKMMDLMAQMFERNAMQTRLLSSLSQRVEQLERAYLCDRLRRRKKRQAAALTVKKCGKR